MRTWWALAVLVAVLALPFLARSRRPAPATSEDRFPAGSAPNAAAAKGSATAAGPERLVVLTPHNEAVRYEFGRAFREHMARSGRQVEVDWRTPGGTAEIARYLASQYTAAFERHWTAGLGRRWSAQVAAGFMAPRQADKLRGLPGAAPTPAPTPGPADDPVLAARREFLASDVSCGIDLLFGGGSSEHVKHAEAGRLVDAGLIGRHPKIFGPAAIPHQVGGQTYWDAGGRWMGTCLSTFGICFNRDVLSRLSRPDPSSWTDLAHPRLHGQLALADPTKSGSIAKAFETLVQAQMNAAAGARALAAGWPAGSTRGTPGASPPEPAPAPAPAAPRGLEEGWARALRLIRRIAGNARYFTDAASKIPLDVSTGDAAAGMCIDYYGRFQAETIAAAGHPRRMGFVAPPGESATDADPIALLRGAPNRDLAVHFIEFVLSEAGQKLWAFRRGTPGGPQRYTLRRLAILPSIYKPDYATYLGDPGENPYQESEVLEYHQPWTGPYVAAMSFVIRVMCVDLEGELQRAYGALAAAGFPPRATAAFDDVSAVDYATVTGPLREALRSPDPLAETAWALKLGRHFRALYADVTRLAEARR